MSKKLFSFRLDQKKIEKVKEKAKTLKISTQLLLEQLVDLVLDDAINLDNKLITLANNSIDNKEITELKKLISDNSDAIKLLSDQVKQLESYQDDDTMIKNGALKPSSSETSPQSVKTVSDGNNDVKSHKDAIALIKELHAQGKNYTEIAKELKGKYLTASGKTNWQGKQVSRVVGKFPGVK